MPRDVCPVWMGYILASPLRRLGQDPVKLTASYITEGMRVLEPGPGMGFFTLALARRVGPGGRLFAVDVQQGMLQRLEARARRAGLADRITTRLAPSGSLGTADLAGSIDFVWAFAMVHETPDQRLFFGDAFTALKKGGAMLVAEPSGHVDGAAFAKTLAAADAAGFTVRDRPRIRSSICALLVK